MEFSIWIPANQPHGLLILAARSAGTARNAARIVVTRQSDIRQDSGRQIAAYAGQSWLQLLYVLKVATAHAPRNAATYPAATLYSELRRGLVPKDAESMRREGKPLLDFKQQITQHRRNHNASFTQTTGIR
jgi:hypothetical protein